jgi:hypothetical protein
MLLILYRIARNILLIYINSIIIKRLFNSTRDIYIFCRNRIKSKTIK